MLGKKGDFKKKVKKIYKPSEDKSKIIKTNKKVKLKDKISKSNALKKNFRTIKRISTGITKLDNLTGKGFVKNSINLLVGGSGNGKSVFSVQFLIDGVKNGENCLYVNLEEKKEEFYLNMSELGFDLEEYEKKEKFFFLEYTPEKIKTMIEEGGGSIESIVTSKKISRIVIDSITPFPSLFEEESEKRGAIISLFEMLRRWSCTSLITYERDPLSDKKTTSRIFEFESDSIIVLYFAKFNDRRRRFLEILKMRGTNHSTQTYEYFIKKKGIFVQKPFKGKLEKEF